MFKVGEKVILRFGGFEGIVTAIAPEEALTWDYKVKYKIPNTERYEENRYHEFELKRVKGNRL